MRIRGCWKARQYLYEFYQSCSNEQVTRHRSKGEFGAVQQLVQKLESQAEKLGKTTPKISTKKVRKCWTRKQLVQVRIPSEKAWNHLENPNRKNCANGRANRKHEELFSISEIHHSSQQTTPHKKEPQKCLKLVDLEKCCKISFDMKKSA